MCDEERRLQQTGGDTVHTVIRAGLSAIPVIGGPAAELFSAIITPPLSRRRDEWIQQIADGLRLLENQVEGFRIENLSENETFITIVMQASQAAIRNHQEEKLIALRNAVLNSALLNDLEVDLQQMFLIFVDSLTAWHLRILKFFEDPRGWGETHGITYPNWTMGGPSTVIEHSFPMLRGRRDFYDQIVKDLYSRGLLGIESLHVTMTGHGMFEPRVTPLGRQFLRYIESPIHQD